MHMPLVAYDRPCVVCLFVCLPACLLVCLFRSFTLQSKYLAVALKADSGSVDGVGLAHGFVSLRSSAATEEARSCQHGLKAYDECLGGHVGFTRKVNLRGILSRQPQNEVLRNLIMSRLPEILACLRFRNMG